MRAIFDNRSVIEASSLPTNILKPFNVYYEFEHNEEFASALDEVFHNNNQGKMSLKGRTEDEYAQCLIYGFAAEAWMNIHGAIPDLRPFRDSFIVRDNRKIPIDVKTKESKHHSVWKTLEHMSEKVLNNTHQCADLEELYVWTFYNDAHSTRAGDLEFWKAYRRLDLSI